MSPEPIRLADYQAAFAARIRDPRRAALPPGAPARRMRVYQDLLFNNLEGFLLACYPVTRQILGPRSWRRVVRRFFIEHRCHSPLFRDIPEAFLEWMRRHAATVLPGLPFLPDFMEYEWLEMAVSVAPDEPGADDIDPDGDLLAQRPALHPAARLASYPYPVHRIGPRFKPAGPDTQRHHYLLFRNEADQVRFILLNPLSAALASLLRDHRPSGQEALDVLADQCAVDDRDGFMRAGTDLLNRLRADGAVLGTWRP